jgi:acyl-CoA dehydrogenase
MASRYPYSSEEHGIFRDTVRDFVKRELVPHVEEWDRAEEFPRELFLRMGGLDSWESDVMKEIIGRARGC